MNLKITLTIVAIMVAVGGTAVSIQMISMSTPAQTGGCDCDDSHGKSWHDIN
jgi:hypothetical protein